MSFTYSVDSETDEAAWHAARAHTEDGQIVVTASEIAMLANGGTSVWANLRAEKAGAKSRWAGNEYTVWGHAREPDIAASVTALYPHLAHNTRLVINDEQPWLRGTPDMIGTDGTPQRSVRSRRHCGAERSGTVRTSRSPTSIRCRPKCSSLAQP